MTRLQKLLHKNPISLIVELGENDPILAETAASAGADALLLNNLENADQVYSRVSIPVGISLKFGNKVNKKELKELKPFDFVSYEMGGMDRINKEPFTRIIRLTDRYSISGLMELEEKAEAIDAAIIPETQAAKNLVIGDLQNYISIIISSSLPVIIPTQRLIKPSEVAIIWDAGAKGIMLNSTVLGKNPRSFEKTIREFRIAVDDLGE